MPADLQIALTGTDGVFLNSRYEKAGVRVREYEVQSGVLVDIGSALLAQYSPSWTPAGEGLALELRDRGGQGSTLLATGAPVFGGNFARGTLTASGNPADGDTVTIGQLGAAALVYTFKDTPAAAFDVQRAATAADSLGNLAAAINLEGDAGPQWYAGTTRHRDAHALTAGSTLTLWAKDCGLIGNLITLAEASAALSWGATTCQGGSGHQGIDLVWEASELTNVDVPEGSSSRKAVWSVVGKLNGGDPVMLLRGPATIYTHATEVV